MRQCVTFALPFHFTLVSESHIERNFFFGESRVQNHGFTLVTFFVQITDGGATLIYYWIGPLGKPVFKLPETGRIFLLFSCL